MSVKILLDCVVTARNPVSCSSNMQILGMVKRLLKNREDVFFYWLIPDWYDKEEVAKFYPVSDRIRYIQIPQNKDRCLGYIQAPQELLDAVSFRSDVWDFDILVTMRTGLLPMLRLNMNCPKRRTAGWRKRVILLEDMPVMAFKDSVPNSDVRFSDLFTLQGYLAADSVYIPSFHEKSGIMQAALENLPPSRVREIESKITEVIMTHKTSMEFKTEEDFPKMDEDKPFVISYCNRMEKAFRLKEVNNIMTKKWIMNGNKVRLLVTTVSATTMVFDTDLVEVVHADVETFWSLQKEMHIGFFIPKSAALSMTLVELMMAGVPMVIQRMPWLVKMFEGYPLFVSNETEAYGFVSMFMEDYAGMYAKWRAWMEEVFQPLMTGLMEDYLLYDHLEKDVRDFDEVMDQFKDKYATMEDNELVKLMVEQAGDKDEIVLADLMREAVAEGKVRSDVAGAVFDKEIRMSKNLIFSLDINSFRLALKAFHGWEDASVVTGHLRKVKGDQHDTVLQA